MTTEIPARVAVLMTCFNRSESTVRCIDALGEQTTESPRSLQIFLVDDASGDGTADAVRHRFPAVTVIDGNGNLYWNGGMRVAFAEASKMEFDYFLWLNDDTILEPDALDTVLNAAADLKARGVAAIVTGSTRDCQSGKLTYGGWKMRKGILKRTMERVPPATDHVRECQTMNGNCTLIPREALERVGILDPGFTHSFADFDYGFRAHKAGVRIFVAPGFTGTCSENPVAGTWRDTSIPLAKRWRHLTSPKGSPFGDWFLYCRRHLGPGWPLYMLSPYLKTVVSGTVSSLKRAFGASNC